MEGLDRVLVATDFGDASDRALDLGLRLASKFDAEIVLLHVYPASISGYGYADGFMWPIAEMAQAAQQKLDPVVAKARARWPKVRGMLASGEPWERILASATDLGADLIVLGTHGRRGVSRVLLGSVAEKVVRLSPTPAITVSSKDEVVAKQRALVRDQAATEG